VAASVCLAGHRIAWVTNPFGDPLALGMLAFPVTVVWIVGIVNALNLIDGLDGLAGGVTLIAVGGTFLLAVHRGEMWFLPVAAALGGATFGFLCYNFYPATIHMGDSGSLLLGYVLAVTAIHGGHKSGTALTLLVPIVMLGLPILDTTLAIARRAGSGRPILAADRDHIHHRLLALGWSVPRSVLGLYAACCGLAAAAIALAFASSAQAAVVLAAVALAAFLLVRGLGYLRRDWGRASAPESGAGTVAAE
jgi:UDP-GlcNAc:undecaprenyl-phosphate GlcNAc-1-phosphate transferase